MRLPLPSFALVLALAAGCRETAAPGPHNLLLVSVDTLRADRVGAWGNPRGTSPTLDRLAAEGVRFADAEAPTSWTLPSHVTMLTGLPISVHGICDHRLWTQPDLDRLAVRGTYLAEVLSDKGWATAGFYSWKFLEPQFGFGRGFDEYAGVAYSPVTLPGVGPKLERLRAEGRTEEARRLLREHADELNPYQPTAQKTVDKALEWLGRQHADRADQPFFLFVHLFDVHDPYTPPPPFDTLFDPDYEGPVDGREVAARSAVVNPRMRPRDLEHLIALYDGEIAWTDSQVARLIQALEQDGLLDDTLVVVTADHGEEFFEHGMKTHRKQLYKESVHVPLLMRLPGALPAGVVVRDPVGLEDLVPTVCSLLDVPPPPGLRGRDLTRLARGAHDQDYEHLTELLHFREDQPGPPARKVGLRRGEERVLVVWEPDGSARAERYDLSQNPRETGPGEPIEPGTPAWEALSRRLDALRRRLREQRAEIPARPLGIEHLDATDLDELAAFGYVDTGTAEAGAPSDRLCLDGCIWVND